MKRNATLGLLFVTAFFLSAPAWADWPVAVTDSHSLHASQNSYYEIDVLANDIGKGLKITAVNEWSRHGGRVSFSHLGDNNQAGYVSYSPPPEWDNFTGDDSFWYAIEDEQGRTNAAKVTVTIKPASSRFPDPQADTVQVQKDTSIRIDVLKNDIANSAKYTDFNEWSEKGGQITEVDDNQLQYTPASGFTGTDTFWYAIKNAGGDATAHSTKVTIQVTPENSAGAYPVANVDRLKITSTCFYYGCSPERLHILGNDEGKNLKITLNSEYSLKGGKVGVIKSYAGYMLMYVPTSSIGSGEDKIWYVIEDEVGRKTWSTAIIDLTIETGTRF